MRFVESPLHRRPLYEHIKLEQPSQNAAKFVNVRGDPEQQSLRTDSFSNCVDLRPMRQSLSADLHLNSAHRTREEVKKNSQLDQLAPTCA